MSMNRVKCRCCNSDPCYNASDSCGYLNASPGTPNVYRWTISGWTANGTYYPSVPEAIYNLGDGTSLKYPSDASWSQMAWFNTAEHYVDQSGSAACVWKYPATTQAWEGVQHWSAADGGGTLLRTYAYFWAKVERTGTGTVTVTLYLTATASESATPQLVIAGGTATGVSQDGSTTITISNTTGVAGTGGTITLTPCDNAIPTTYDSAGDCVSTDETAPSYVSVDSDDNDDLLAALAGAGGELYPTDFYDVPEWDNELTRSATPQGYYHNGTDYSRVTVGGSAYYIRIYANRPPVWPDRFQLTVWVLDDSLALVEVWTGDRYRGCWPTGEFRRRSGSMSNSTVTLEDPPLP